MPDKIVSDFLLDAPEQFPYISETTGASPHEKKRKPRQNATRKGLQDETVRPLMPWHYPLFFPGLILILGLLLRLPNFNASLWYDEVCYTLTTLSGSSIKKILFHDVHPPLYPLFMRGLSDDRRWQWLLFIGASVLALWTNQFALWVIIATCLWLWIKVLTGGDGPDSNEPSLGPSQLPLPIYRFFSPPFCRSTLWHEDICAPLPY